MIRPATLEDIPRILEMCEQFFKASHWAQDAAYDPALVGAVVASMIRRDDAAAFVSPQGLLIVIIVPLWFSGDLTAQELFFWTLDGQGSALRRAAEQWAQAKGALAVVMGSHEPGRTETAAAWYRRAGYVPHGHTFKKVLIHGD